MKKICIVAICFLLVGTTLVFAAPNDTTFTLNPVMSTAVAANGTFSGFLKPTPNGTTIGTIQGLYQVKNRGGRFTGEWALQIQNHSAAGTFMGRFSRHIFIGKLIVEGQNRTLPVIGFLRFGSGTFAGRGMSLVGPALYFMGTYS